MKTKTCIAVAAVCAALSLHAGFTVDDAVYDGSQSNNVKDVSVAGSRRATLSFRVQTPATENPMYAVIAEYGQVASNDSFRVTFNGRRERRVCGFYGDKRVYSAPNALDDGLLHHVALDVEPGRSMTLYLDGVGVDSVAIPDHGFASGQLAVAQRVVKGSPDDAWYLVHSRWSHFRGRVADVALVPGAFDAAKVAGGTAAKPMPLALPPDPFAMTPKWERPKTTRRYLHGPFAERLLTFWRDGKVAFGEVEHRDDWSLDYRRDLHAHAAWLVHGALDEPFDFRAAHMIQPEGGEPDHAQKWRVGDLDVELAACAPFGRRPSAHVRLTVRNMGDKALKEPFAFLLREGLESKLLFGAPDVYKIFSPSVADWAEVSPSGWSRDGDVMRHGERFAAFGGAPFEWDAAKGAARFEFELKPGESRSLEMELGKGVRHGLGYDAARKRMYADWSKELSRLRIPGDASAMDARIIRNLAVQMLQCLSAPTDGDFVLPRQGGLQRYVWPGDADCFLEGLDAVGYADYVAKCIDFYYSHCQRENGEAGPFKNNWAGDTASVLRSFARHCLVTDDAACWRKWRDAAFRGFGWIQSKRAEGGGLFPSMKATDHPAVLRAWGSNDMKGLEAYAAFAKAAARFGDARAAEVAAAEADYRASLSKAMDVCRAKAAGRDEFEVPITANGEDDPFLESFMFYLHPGRFAENGLLTVDEMLRLRTWLMRRGYANANGLYANQLSRDMSRRDHIWYTTWTELQWYRAWRRVGRDDLAEQTLDACLKYALTDELYVGERYHDANPWYYPWSPNASGSGRITMMLLERKRREREYIWPNGKMPGAGGSLRPYIDWYAPDPSRKTDLCILNVSGGGPGPCCGAGRQNPVIDRFVKAGFTVADLVCRQVSLEDVQRAVRVVRSQAAKRGFDPDKIGATGMSGGAKAVLLAATCSMTPAYRPVDEIDALPCGLLFAIPQAPAYVLTDGEGGPNAREGDAPDVTLVPELKFDARTCPMCLFHGGLDDYSPLGSTHIYRQLRRMGIPAEIHLFADSRHGSCGDMGNDDDADCDNWFQRAEEFIRQMNFDGRLGDEVKLMHRYDENNSRSRSVREDVWPDGKTPPGHVDQCVPYIEWHFPLARKTRAIQIIFSGGGYHWNKPEGMEVAPARRYLNSKGMTVVTLKYREPRPAGGLAKHTSAWQDLQRAVRIVRSKAAANGLDPDRIGIMGGSAGGHLALMGATSSRHKSYLPVDDIDKVSCKVQWAVAVYPAYSLTDGVDCQNTNGGNGDEDCLVPEFSFDLDTCPVLFLHGDADGYSAMASVKAWERLRRMGIQGEVHTFATRQHCFQNKAAPGTGSYTYLDRIWEFMNHKRYNAP